MAEIEAPLDIQLSDADQVTARLASSNAHASSSRLHESLDRVAFQYVAAIAAFDVAAATGEISPQGTLARAAVALIPPILLGVGVFAIWRRSQQLEAVYRAYVHLENVLGCYAESRTGGNTTLLPKQWLNIDSYVGMKQATPQLVGLVLLAIIGAALVYFRP